MIFEVGDRVYIPDEGVEGTITRITSKIINENHRALIELGLLDENDLKTYFISVDGNIIIKSHKQINICDSGLTYTILKDRKGKNVNSLNKVKVDLPIPGLTRCKIVSITEDVKTEIVKVPQYKAAPRFERIKNKVVRVQFSSGNIHEAICMSEDEESYDLARGIEVCILKEIMGSTKNYNDFMRKCVKKHKNDIIIDTKKAEEEKLKARRIAKEERRKKERIEKRKAKERQEKIDIQAEAFLKAMKMYDQCVVNEKHEEFLKFR